MKATWPLAAVDAAAWAAIQVGAGYLAHRLPSDRLEHDAGVLRLFAFERGSFYERVLRVRAWKDRLPEAGAVFTGGRDKRSLGGTSDAALRAYARETRRAELAHWMALGAIPAFALWNPAWLMPAMVTYAVAVNAPCIVALRYNRGRIERLLSRRSERAGRA